MTLDPGVSLLETMRAEAGRVALWPLHRARLAGSAAAFGVPLDASLVGLTVAEAVRHVADPARLRLTVDAAGKVRVEVLALSPRAEAVAVDPEPWRLGGARYCIHKTTERTAYDEALARAQALGADEALLVAPDGRLVEGTRTTVWVERGGRLLTPPLTSGGLPGVMRAHILARRADAAEADLTRDDLRAAEAVWLSNALHGLWRVRLIG